MHTELLKPFVIRLADKRIQIEPMYPMIREYCKEYVEVDQTDHCVDKSDRGIDLTVHSCNEDILYEKERSDREVRKEGKQPIEYPVDYLETLAVYRQIAEWMPQQGIVLFHGSVVAVDGKAYLFTAKSGTGKSTHTRLWREYFGERAIVVNDDKPLLKVSETAVTAYGTPWDGKHRLSTNIGVPLEAVCVLSRAAGNKIQEITSAEVYPMLLQQCYRPQNINSLTKTM